MSPNYPQAAGFTGHQPLLKLVVGILDAYWHPAVELVPSLDYDLISTARYRYRCTKIESNKKMKMKGKGGGRRGREEHRSKTAYCGSLLECLERVCKSGEGLTL